MELWLSDINNYYESFAPREGSLSCIQEAYFAGPVAAAHCIFLMVNLRDRKNQNSAGPTDRAS
jgi:hypothetical protein